MATSVYLRSDFFEHPRIKELEKHPDYAFNTQILICLHMQAEIIMGRVAFPANMQLEEIAKKIRVTPEKLDDAIRLFIKTGLARRLDDGTLRLTEINTIFKEPDVGVY